MKQRLGFALKQRGVRISLILMVILLALGSFAAYLPHQAAKAADNTTEDILLVHGYNVKSIAPCDVFGTAKQLFPGLGWTGNIKRLNYYTSTDGNCDSPMDFGDARCNDYHTNNPDPIISFTEGQANETIQHIGCRFAWYVWDNYTSQNKNVRVIAHSMGGVVVRWAMYATEIRDKNTLGANAFPSSIGISRIVTVSSPHAGAVLPHNGAGPGVVVDEQGAELDPASDFLKVLNSPVGLDPQVGSTTTYWTTIGSEGDTTVGADSAIYMGSNAKIVYRQAPFNDPSMGPQNLDHGSILSDGILHDPSSGKAYLDTRQIAPVNYCDANCGVGTPSSMSHPFYYRSVYAVYLHITDSLVPPTPTPVPPTATLPNPTATPLPPPPVSCSASLNPHWAYENSNTVNKVYSQRAAGQTFNLTIQVHVELQSYVDTQNNYCGSMRTMTTVSNVAGTCGALNQGYCSIAGEAGAYTHYKRADGSYADTPTATNSGNSLSGFNVTSSGQALTCASGEGYFTPVDNNLDAVSIGMGEHCRTAPTCTNATISNPTQPFNLNGATGTLGVYLEKGQSWNGSACVFNGVQSAVAEVHLSNGTASGRITAQIFGNENPPLGHNHQDVDFTGTTYADATTTNSQNCGHARADLTINGAFLRLETGTYCG